MTPRPPLILGEPERPFWGFGDLLLAIAVLMAALWSVVGISQAYLHAPPESGLWNVLEEATAYVVLFLALKIMFVRYRKGLFESLGWSKPGPFTPLSLAATGVCLYLLVAMFGYLLRTPEVQRPFDKLLDDPASRIAVGLFSITFGPVVEELLFRGFLQPLLVGVTGVFPGILITALLFGLLHLSQYGNQWQTAVLLAMVGFVFGTIRHVSGSTRASTIVHVAFNSVPFLALLAGGSALTTR